ncbi:DNA repair protein RAD51 homolog 3-like [Ptychodera flava]|uniref:DNA repair protein RAD51 homolog 3-like n=1 Tax=Ptychodera flava TaxID=63121 RepID=UPI003969C270
MQRDIATFPFPPEQKRQLLEAGFQTVSDLLEVSPIELAKELGVSNEDALEILEVVKGKDGDEGAVAGSKKSLGTRSMSALEKLKEEQELTSVITFCEELDDILGGGVPMTKITEMCGVPGIGKTQLCMQLAVDVQIPAVFGGCEGEAVYVDTEGSFMVDRVIDIAQGTVTHCQHITGIENNPEHKEAMDGFTVESILSKIYVYRCSDYLQLLATVILLPEFLQSHTKVKLVVIDSVAFHFRSNFDDMASRTRILNGLAQNLIKMATQFQLAVVLTNQMTTRFRSDVRGQSQLVPALGESWGHASTIRVILFWENNQRFARLYKSPSKKDATVPYQITMDGVRSVSTECPDVNAVATETPVAAASLQATSQECHTETEAEMTPMKNPRKRVRSDD